MKGFTYIRFFVPSLLAGAFIGKDGSTIRDFRLKSGASIRLSQKFEFYPRTTDRIITISGTIAETLEAVKHFLGVLLKESLNELLLEVRLLVPQSSFSSTLGKRGGVLQDEDCSWSIR